MSSPNADFDCDSVTTTEPRDSKDKLEIKLQELIVNVDANNRKIQEMKRRLDEVRLVKDLAIRKVGFKTFLKVDSVFYNFINVRWLQKPMQRKYRKHNLNRLSPIKVYFWPSKILYDVPKNWRKGVKKTCDSR